MAQSPSAGVASLPVAESPVSLTATTSAAPQRLAGDVADVLVRVRGGAMCSGTPIAGTAFVVTAAHCVIGRDGTVERRTVERDGVVYRAEAVLVDVRYHEDPRARYDAAVLIMDRPIPGPAATLGAAVPSSGRVTLAGFQSIDSDGSLLRGTNPHNTPAPLAARIHGGTVQVDSAPAGCDTVVADVVVTVDQVWMPCGLIPGASGGGMFVTQAGQIELVGIVSSVSADITHNGVVPMASLVNLLEHQADFLHVPVEHVASGGTSHVVYS